MKTFKPKTIKEAIDNLQLFLSCDLYSLFRPKEILDGKAWYRTNPFKDEGEFQEYLKMHFDVLKEEVKGLKK